MKEYINKIICGDCLEVIKNISDNFIDLTITSPPYDNLRKYKGYSFDFKNIAKELYRVTKKHGVLVWIVGDAIIKGSETGSSFRQALFFKEIGFNLHDTMIWKKSTFSFPQKNRYHQVFEYMFIFSKGKPKTFNIIKDRQNKYANTLVHGTQRKKDGSLIKNPNHNKKIIKNYGARFNVWEINEEKHNISGHPAVFPEKLAEDHVLSWSNKNDIVLDPFLGSGTVACICKKLKRNYIGIEISKDYCKIAKERLKNEITNKKN